MLIQFHMVLGPAWQACQHMGSSSAMAGFMWSLPHSSQQWYAREAGPTTEPCAWAVPEPPGAPGETRCPRLRRSGTVRRMSSPESDRVGAFGRAVSPLHH